MALKDADIRAFRGIDTPYKRADEKGLYLEIFPNGSKLWQLKFRFAGKEKRLEFGGYHEISLAKARKLRDGAKQVSR